MNDTIALPALAARFAQATSTDIETAEKFIRQFFTQIENALSVEASLSIEGFGTFSRTNDADAPVIFTPAAKLIDQINAPFSIFAPVEIADGITNEDLEWETETATEPEAEEVPEVVVEQEPESAPESEPTPEPEPEPEIIQIVEAPQEIVVEEPQQQEVDEPQQQLDEPQQQVVEEQTEGPSQDIDDEDEERSQTWLWHTLFFVLGLAIGCAVMSLIIKHYYISSIETTPIVAEEQVTDTPDHGLIAPAEQTSTEIEPKETEGEALEVATKEPIYDTVSRTRFLTTMAREHYHCMEYWVFIYEANADKLGNPNRITPGTQVVIPDMADFTKGETPEQTLARAERMGREIYARYE